MSELVEVRLWGTTIGYLGYSPGQRKIATFEYDDAFTPSGVAVSPIAMKYPPPIHSFDNISERTFKGLPGVFADSLPDKFGNQLIDLYMAEKNIPTEEITALDRLLYVGARGMGALEYEPARDFDLDNNRDTVIDVHLLSELAELVMSRQEDKREQLFNAETRSKTLRLIRIGSSAGGARSKALVARSSDGQLYDGTVDHGSQYTYWMLKFDIESNADRDGNDPKGMTKVEYIYSLIARNCGIKMPRTDYIEDGNEFHFLIERFDRVKNGVKLEKRHYASWAGLAHADRDTTGMYSYEELILLARQMGLGQDTVTELFRRAIFNVIGRNQDDHTKNFGFLMNKSGKWRLSPAFDMTYSFDPIGKWTKVHQIRLNKKQDDFERKDLLQFARYCNLEEKKAVEIINGTLDGYSSFMDYAKDYNVNKDLSKVINKSLRLKL
ncbi:type II toxin-antitoxin system HipA family toxin [bacterium]|nr:type II toxin-antitoxin system HipA family toxin [bacterium]